MSKKDGYQPKIRDDFKELNPPNCGSSVINRDEKIMKLYEVKNGYIGESCVKVFVIAESEERAQQLAYKRYKKHAEEKNKYFKVYSQSYFTNLTAECLCEDVRKEWATEPRDY
ncbi:MAG: hypothetical protein AB6733_12215 [Clostridiaceae bacterium]